MTLMQVMIVQRATQLNPGGMSEIYIDIGTYMKSFYSVMCCPSAVKVSVLGSDKSRMRIHHSVKWECAAVKILSEAHRKIRLTSDQTSDITRSS